jgi:hypothetical protein
MVVRKAMQGFATSILVLVAIASQAIAQPAISPLGPVERAFKCDKDKPMVLGAQGKGFSGLYGANE